MQEDTVIDFHLLAGAEACRVDMEPEDVCRLLLDTALLHPISLWQPESLLPTSMHYVFVQLNYLFLFFIFMCICAYLHVLPFHLCRSGVSM